MSDERQSVLHFSGARQCVPLRSARALGLTDASFTVEAWVCVDRGDADLPILGTDETVPDQGLHLLIRQGQPYLGFYRNDTMGHTTLLPGQWYHVAFVYERAAGVQAIYLNGVLDGRREGAAPFQGTGTVYLGRFAGSLFFAGALRELRIWHTARSQQEILEHLWSQLSGAEPGLSAYFPLDDGPGETLRDARAEGLYGRLHGVTWHRSRPRQAAQKAGPETPEAYAQFDGRSWVEIDDSPDLRITGDQTIELRFRAEVIGGVQTLIQKAWGAEGSLRLEDGVLVYRYGIKDGNRGQEEVDVQVLRGGRVHPDRWYVARVCRDLSPQASLTLSLDGREVARAAARFPASGVSRSPLTLGGEPGGERGFRGAITDVRLWRSAVSGVGGEAAEDLVGCWPLHEGRGSVQRNRVETSRSFRLEGPAWTEQAVPPLGMPAMALSLRSEGDGLTLAVPVEAPRGEARLIIEWWVQSTETRPEATLFCFQGRTEGFTLTGPGGLTLSDEGGHRLVTGLRIDDGAWHHVALFWGAGSVAVALDGGEPGEPLAVQMPDRGQITLGYAVGGNGQRRPGTVAIMRITDVRAWEGDPEARSTLRGRMLRGTEPGLLAWYPLAHSSGALGLPRRGDVPFLTSGAWVRNLEPLRPRPVFRFEGPDSVTVPPDPGLDAASFTVEAWVMPQRADGSPPWMSPVVSKHGPASGWELRCNTVAAAFVVTVRGQHFELIYPHGAASGWVHLAGVYDGQRLALYINGIFCGDQVVGGPLSPFLGPLELGRNPVWQERLFQGLMAEVRLWSTARSAAEVHGSLWQRCTGREIGLIAAWPLDGLEGDRTSSLTGRHDGITRGADVVSRVCPLRLRTRDTAVLAPGPVDPQVRELRRERDQLLDLCQRQRQTLEQQGQEIARLQGELGRLMEGLKQATAGNEWLARELESQRQAALQAQADRDSLHQSLVEKGAQVSLAELIKRSNDEVARARAVLESRGGAYRLGKVSLELKMVPGAGGVGLSFPTVEEIAQLGSTGLSTLHLDFSPKDQESGPPVAKRRVPNVVGATEILARRKLSEAGYLVEVNFQAVSSRAGDLSQVDRVVTQVPAAGQETPPGATVLLFIGKEA